MSLQAVGEFASSLANKCYRKMFDSPYKCYAMCTNNIDYQDLIVTKCNHIFCRNCLEDSVRSKQICPNDNIVTLPPITNENVRQKNENPKINKDSTEGMPYSSFQLHLDRFIYYIKEDFTALEKKLKVKPSQESGEDNCSICLEPYPQMYFITQDKDQNRGRFMHEGCLQKTVYDKRDLLDISVQDMVKVAQKLPSPPYKPPSPIKVVFLAIILPISFWALAMNTRIYHNKSFVLFVLSIPALIIFKVLSFILNGLKAAFNVKPT